MPMKAMGRRTCIGCRAPISGSARLLCESCQDQMLIRPELWDLVIDKAPRSDERQQEPVGAVYIRDGRAYVYVHDHPLFPGKRRVTRSRLVMAEMLDRPLFPGEVVHHKDGDTLNDNPANLKLMTQSEHARLHRLGKSSPNKGRLRGPLSADHRAKVSAAQKAAWQDSEYRAKQEAALAKARDVRRTKVKDQAERSC